MNFAIIAAGGKGTRFQSTTSKQLLPLMGRTVLAWTLQPFLKSKEIDEIILAYPQDEPESEYRKILEQEHSQKIQLVKGGDTRYRSVRNAFEKISNAKREDLILIHDAARPVLPGVLLRNLIEAANKKAAVIPVVPMQETVKEVTEHQIVRTVPRENLFLAQTPQIFQYWILETAYNSKHEPALATDEAILAEKAGFYVSVIKGDRRNIKITEPADLELVEFYLSKGLE
jgi:2-C-methyl-D-erythritol 4-phosphate cytidylyltransferase